MLDDTQVVEVSVEQSVEQNNELNVVDVNKAMEDAIAILQKDAKQQYNLQTKATHKLYNVLEKCLNIVNACKSNSKMDTALRVIALTYDTIKKTDGVPTSTLISKMVFVKVDDNDKRAYTYAKALEKAEWLKLQTEENNQTLTQYLKNKGGIDKLIRLDTSAPSDADFADERMGTKEHFAEWVMNEVRKSPNKRNDFVSELSKSEMLKIKLTAEMKAQLAAFDHHHCFLQIEWSNGSNEASVVPYIVGLKSDKATFKQLEAVQLKYTAELVQKETTECWSKYIKRCEERSAEMREELTEETKQLVNAISNCVEGAK